MRNLNSKFISILFLFVGLAIGGAAVYYFTKPVMKPAAPAEKKKEERKPAFYRNPMDPSVTSPIPMKDPMGMDYIPVYEDELKATEAPGVVRISPEKMQKIGVKSEEARKRTLKRVIRTVGRVEPVEDRIFVINAKVTGWVERLYVNQTDQMVSTGEKLLDLYSPDLVSAQEEYLLALNSYEQAKESPYAEVRTRAEALLDASRQRLKYWDISDDQIRRLKETGSITRTMTIRSPHKGSVIEKMVVEGQKIEAGEPLFKIIDHSVVWVYGEVYEYEMPYIKIGQMATISPAYSPTEVYKGRIEHIYSHLGSIRYVHEQGIEVRTAKVRFSLPNKGHRLKLGMFLNVELSAQISKEALSVPDSAVIDTGKRQVVIVDRRDGTFEPRAVKVGAKAEGFYEVLEGVKEGEWIVVSANFLIDSESNLKAAIGSLGEHRHGGAQAPAASSMPEAASSPAPAPAPKEPEIKYDPKVQHKGH